MIENYEEMNLSYLSKNEVSTVLHIGEALLGVPQDELGIEFIQAYDEAVVSLDNFLHRDIHILLYLFNSRIMSILIGRSFKKYNSMTLEKREQYTNRWMKSKFPLFRTVYRTLQSLCGWSYYSLEKCHEEMDYPGHTIGREHETPTFLYGKEPWSPKKNEVEVQ
jgi:hypothetical protein